MIQAVLFDIKHWKTPDARRWLKNHNYKPIKKVHKTDKYLRYRLIEPNDKDKYRTLNFGKNIKVIYKI